jgi:hypothetical protein
MSTVEVVSNGNALALAEQAHALVQARPRQALGLAERARSSAVAARDAKAEVAALHALAYAQFTLGDPQAIETIRAGVRLGERHGDRRGVALLRRLLAGIYAHAGKMSAAQREIDAAVALLSGRDRARSEVHRVAVYGRARTGDPEAHRRICAAASSALRVLRKNGDEIWEARLLYNRGLLHLDRSEFGRAAADLERALALFGRLGYEAAAAQSVVALASLALLRGDVLSCLKTLDEVEAALPPGHVAVGLARWRATALAQARLLPEARRAAERYIELCARSGVADEVAPAMLDLAALTMMTGDGSTALRYTTAATRSFAARGKRVNAALAQTASLRARLLSGTLRRSSARTGLQAATRLDTAGWHRDALRARVVAARAALALGATATARRQLELARPLRARGSVTDRIEVCHALALLHLADGDRAGAERLLRSGLELLDDYRAALGAFELRAASSGIGVELSRAGLRIAIEAGEASKILAWAERLRGNAQRLPPVRPPADRVLQTLQTELRRVAREVEEAVEKGTVAPGATARLARLEAAIRARTRVVPGAGTGRSGDHGHDRAARALGPRALVEYVELDGGLGALTQVDGQVTFHHLGSDTSDAQLEWLGFALGRLARGRLDATSRAAARANAEAATSALDDLLVQPLLPALGDRPLVLVPTGALHALPWGTLPSLRARPLVVTPSLAVWLDLDARPHGRRRKKVVIAGPRLRHSAAEVREIAALLPDATVLRGRAARVQDALAALDGAALAHVACHGSFRADSPMFSSLQLADGPLNVYDLQRLRRPPEVMVLSACDLAVSGLHPGDELLGFAAALLQMGTRTIVASVAPIPDASSRRLMLAFHRELLAGRSAAAALAGAQAGAAVAGFVCLGGG